MAYYVIWHQGRPYYADPDSGAIKDWQGNLLDWTVQYNKDAGKWNLYSPYGNVYTLGEDWAFYDQTGSPFAYVNQSPVNDVGVYQPGGDYFRFMRETGRGQGIYGVNYGTGGYRQQGQQGQQGQAPQPSPDQGNQALDELYKIIMQIFTGQVTDWQNTLNALLKALANAGPLINKIGTPGFYQNLYNAIWKAVEQPRQQTAEAIRQGYMSDVPGVLDMLASAGTLNSTAGANVMSALAAQYLQQQAQQQAQWAQLMPQYLGAGTGAGDQRLRTLMTMPNALLSLLQTLPGGNLGTISQLLGIFDLIGRIFL